MLPALLATIAAGYLTRRAGRWWHERASAARLPVGADGVVPGAHTIDLRASEERAALLLHGFGDTPQTLTYLADHLHLAGWSVRAPLLPGHGRRLRDFARSGADEWIRMARDEYSTLRRRHGEVVLVGLSMGGALATIVAAEADLPALVLIAPYLEMPPGLETAVKFRHLWATLVPYVSGGGDASIVDEAEREKSLAYGISTGRLLHELETVVRRARTAAARVRAPTLVIQSRQDHRIAPDAAERGFARLGASEKRLEWLEGCGHILTVDVERERVFELAEGWIASHS